MASRTCATLNRLLIVVGFVALAGGVSQDMQLRGSPPSVRIDAVVTDQRGHAVVGLRGSDFEVVENGTPRPVRRAEFRGISRHNPHAAIPIVTELDEQRAAADLGTRVFAFFLDEFHVSSGASTERVRDAVTSFIDEKLFAADLAAVVTPFDSVSSIGLRVIALFCTDRSLPSRDAKAISLLVRRSSRRTSEVAVAGSSRHANRSRATVSESSPCALET